ncbi:hypothetical protein JCM19233_253 [Vibrio astriarenae]|nr:hypothetical protein JCM19233_253 [Vibrio sp. C7]
MLCMLPAIYYSWFAPKIVNDEYTDHIGYNKEKILDYIYNITFSDNKKGRTRRP